MPPLSVVAEGRSLQGLHPAVLSVSIPRYDRHVRLFGDRGQDLLGKTKVAVVGLGGVGSVVAELLGRLGVGRFVLVEPERAEPTNQPRLIGASRWDVGAWLADAASPRWLRALRRLMARRKVNLARRNIRRASPRAIAETLASVFQSQK